MAEDFFVILLSYPCAAFQLDQHMIDEGDYNIRKKDDDFYMKDLTNSQPHVHAGPEVATAFSHGGKPHENRVYVINEMPVESVHL